MGDYFFLTFCFLFFFSTGVLCVGLMCFTGAIVYKTAQERKQGKSNEKKEN